MAAIFAALVQQKIVYNDPPASYEVIGQRIRLPHKVLEQKMGTCLDLAVLYAACLEAVGLHPLLLFMTGHAFCGCWLENETFADCCVDDVSAIEKRIAENAEEMLLVECTDFVDSNVHDAERFDHAMKQHGISMRHRHYPHPWKWHKTYPTASRANLFRYATCRRIRQARRDSRPLRA